MKDKLGYFHYVGGLLDVGADPGVAVVAVDKSPLTGLGGVVGLAVGVDADATSPVWIGVPFMVNIDRVDFRIVSVPVKAFVDIAGGDPEVGTNLEHWTPMPRGEAGEELTFEVVQRSFTFRLPDTSWACPVMVLRDEWTAEFLAEFFYAD